MLSRDLPYQRGLTWRKPSFLVGDEHLQDGYRAMLEAADNHDLFLLEFMIGETTKYEPAVKWYGGWRTMGPGRRFTLDEILLADDLTGIEFVRKL
jgi:hypothetical protein